MNEILFFGYGANRDKKRLEDIFKISGLGGKDLEVKGGNGARVDGMVLGIQHLNQIPEQVRVTLEKVWGEKFRAYTLKPGNGQVAGVVWELSEKQYEAIKKWEFDGIWREIKEIEIVTQDQKKIKLHTEKAFDNAPIREIVDGLNYESNLNLEGMKPETKKDDEYRIKELQSLRQKLAQITQNH